MPDNILRKMTNETIIWETEDLRFAYSPSNFLMVVLDRESPFTILSNKETYELYAKLKAEIEKHDLSYWLKEDEEIED